MHRPVLLSETLEHLDPKPNENFVDCTLGEGGHSKAILERTGPKGKVLGIDQDQRQIEKCQRELGERLIPVRENFAHLEKIIEREKFAKVSGILADLGLSTWHLQESQRGFSFRKDEPLDMRLSGQGLSARDIINDWPEDKIFQILQDYGEEKFSRRIAQRIVQARRAKFIETTKELSELISSACPRHYERGRIHPATRTFLALRIVVNQELENLKSFLPQALKVLQKNGRLVVISFNSQEDRLVKNFLREEEQSGRLRQLTAKPVTPSSEELEQNPASRSAKLRAGLKLPDDNDHGLNPTHG